MSLLKTGDDAGTHDLQTDYCRRLVAAEGGSIVFEGHDTESGLVAKRDAYQHILTLARRREIDAVAVMRYDRLGRDNAEMFRCVKELALLDVAIRSATEGSDPLLRDLSFVLANEESRRLAARIYPRQLELARAGRLVTAPPFGYRLEIDPDSPDPLRPKRRLIVHEGEAAVHRELCGLFLAGRSYQALSEWLLKAHGYKAKWSSIRDRLANPIYAGYATWNRRQRSKLRGSRARPPEEHVLVPGAAPAVIDEETYGLVRAELARRYRNHGRTDRPPLPLVGLLYCACGSRMYGNRSTYGAARPDARPIYTYRCNSKYTPEPCPHPSVAAARLEWAIAEAILRPIPPAVLEAALEVARKATTIDDRAEIVRRQAAERRREMLRQRASRLIDRLLDGTLTPEAYREKAAEIEVERASLVLPEPAPARPVDLAAVARLLSAGITLEELGADRRRRLFLAAVARADWRGAAADVRWTAEVAAIKGAAGATIAPVRRRRAGGYLVWTAD